MNKMKLFTALALMFIVIAVPFTMGEEVDAANGDVAGIESYVAEVEGMKYTTIRNAIDAATSGQTITIIDNFELSTSVTIGSEKVIILDLNGKTITGTDPNTEGNFELINNSGTLTVKDSVGGGKITLTATTDRDWNSYSAVISNMWGTFTIESGTIQHMGGTDMAYAIDNRSNTGAELTILTVNGGTIDSTYRAIRQYANSTSGECNLVVTDGTINGGNKALVIQSSNKNANMATTDISGGDIGSIYLYAPAGGDSSKISLRISGGTFTGNISVKESDYHGPISINGGTYSEDPSAYLTSRYTTFGTNPYVVIPSNTTFVAFSEPAGEKNAAFDLTLSTSLSGGEIRYTIDGTVPTATTGNVYSSAVKIEKGCIVNAIIVLNGQASSVYTAEYTFKTSTEEDGVTTETTSTTTDIDGTTATQTQTTVTDTNTGEVTNTTVIETPGVKTESTTTNTAGPASSETTTTVITTVVANDTVVNDEAIEMAAAQIEAIGATDATVSIVIEVAEDAPATITISSAAIDDIIGTGAGITVKDNDGTKQVELDTEVLENIGTYTNITLSIEEASEEDLNDAQQEAAGEGKTIIKLTLEVDGESRSDLKGTATIQIQFDIGDADPKDIVVYRLNSNGTTTEVEDVGYDPATKTITFLRDTFSYYAIGIDASAGMPDFIPLPDRPQGGVEVTLPGNETPSEKENNTKIIACAAAAVVAAALALFLVIDTRRP